MSEWTQTRAPTHPGAILREDVLPALGMTVTDAAEALGVSRQQVHRIMAETAPVTPEMAVRLGKFCGNGPDLWMRMQASYDLWNANRELKREIERIPVASVIKRAAAATTAVAGARRRYSGSPQVAHSGKPSGKGAGGLPSLANEARIGSPPMRSAAGGTPHKGRPFRRTAGPESKPCCAPRAERQRLGSQKL